MRKAHPHGVQENVVQVIIPQAKQIMTIIKSGRIVTRRGY